MTTIKKNGNVIVPNLYECKAMSIFVDGNGMALQNSVTYTPNTGSNSCMPERVVTVTPNVQVHGIYIVKNRKFGDLQGFLNI